MRKFSVVFGLILMLALGVFPAAAQNRQVVITLERTACFGFCPIYSVTIYNDGTVVYEGDRYVEVEGRQTAQIDVETVEQMIAVFEAAGYFEWEDAYTDMYVTDGPYVITSVTRDGETKRINRYDGDASAPLALEYVEYWIDRTVNSAQWIGEELSPPYFLEAGAPVISLERGACFAECPEYQVVIYNDGTVFYLGFDNVAETGIHMTTIEVEEVTALTEAMVEQGHLELEDEYVEQNITDQQTVMTSLIWEGEIKRIVRYDGDANAPEVLAALEDAIDQVVNSDQWIAE